MTVSPLSLHARRLIDVNQCIARKAPAFCADDQGVERGAIELRLAREYPQIITIRPRQQRVAIVRVEHQHIVRAIKRPEKRHLQTADVPRPLEARHASCIVPRVLRRIETAIDHLDAAIRKQTVLRRHIGQTAFEAMIAPRDFIPTTEIALQLEASHRMLSLGHARATGEQRLHSQPPPLHVLPISYATSCVWLTIQGPSVPHTSPRKLWPVGRRPARPAPPCKMA